MSANTSNLGFGELGGAISSRPLKFFWILDCSGSMQGEKIAALNRAIKSCVKPMQDVAAENPEAQMYVRAIKFSSGAFWHIAQDTPVEKFVWNDLSADGITDMGAAMKLLAQDLSVEKMPERGLPPVLVLISDGEPTDNFEEGLQELISQPWGKKAVRLAIAIGEDANIEVMKKFCSHAEIPPLVADNAATLTNYIKWASTKVVDTAAKPPSQVAGKTSQSNVPLSAPAPVLSDVAVDDAW